MDIDVKVIRVYVWKFSVLIAGLCFRFAQKHPCISGTLLSCLVLYVFFPLVLKLLLYSSPIMVWVYASRKNDIKFEHSEALIKKKDDQMNDGNSRLVKVDGNVLAKKRYVNFSMQNGRIDTRVKNKESANYIPELPHKAHGEEEYDLNKSISESESDIIGKAKNDLRTAENSMKKAEIAETGVGELSEANGNSETAIPKKAEYKEKEKTPEDAQGIGQKVECTKQDENKSMDLGTSETERDKRLDSLIQKRRARKLLSMQVRNVMDIMRHPHNQIAPLVIARSTGPFNLINTLSDTDDLHMPGSAPSVLLPTRSPFDLPYDPFEERPNLTGDNSFQQEFLNTDQKDAPFGHCQDGNPQNAFMNKEKKGMARHGFSRFRSYRERGSYESLSPGASAGEHELMSRDDLIIHDYSYEEQFLNQPTKSLNVPPWNHAESENIKSSVNFLENNEKRDPELLNAESGKEGSVTQVPVKGDSNNQGEGEKAVSTRNTSSEDVTSYLQISLTPSLQEILAKEAKENAHEQSPALVSSKDPFNVHKRVLHTPAHSIASDLVVEVSEAGSPPPALSPADGDSSHYDGDVDRDISSGSEDMSMHVYKMEDHDTRCSEGQQGLAPEESTPEAVELEQDVLDGYEHTSLSSSDDDSSYENVVQHLNEKLKDRLGDYAELSVPASSESNAVTSEKHYEQEAGLNSDTPCSRELDGVTTQQAHQTFEESLLPLGGKGSRNTGHSEVVQGGAEMSSSSFHVALSNAQPAQADEELPKDSSSKSVLPDIDLSDLSTRSETQPSEFVLPDNLPDAFQPEDSIPSMSESPDLKFSTSERDTKEATMKRTESEADIDSATSENHASEASVNLMLLDIQGDLLVGSVYANTDKSNSLAEKSPELNVSSTESFLENVADDPPNSREPPVTSELSVDIPEGHAEQKPVKPTEPLTEADSRDEAQVPNE